MAICKYCGKEFEIISKGRGVERTYCYDEACIKASRKEAREKWKAKNYVSKKEQAKKASETAAAPEVIVEQVVKAREFAQVKPTYVKEERVLERNQETISTEDVQELRLLARELNAVRYKIQQALYKAMNEQSQGDKTDQNFLHRLETDDLTEQEAVQLIAEWKKARETRRGAKNKRWILQKLISFIPINSEKVVVDMINTSKNQIYHEREIDGSVK